MRRPRALATAGLTALALSGCAERRLVAGPADRPTATTWATVWLAGALAALVVGVLLTLPAWRRRRGARTAVVVLTATTPVSALPEKPALLGQLDQPEPVRCAPIETAEEETVPDDTEKTTGDQE